MADVEIVTSAHWEGDARLRRHVSYLRAAGHEATITSFAERRRIHAVLGALNRVARTSASHILFPDPELFMPGSALTRLRGKRPLIDIHEDYRAVAMSRSWAPRPIRPVVSLMAGIAIRVGRLLAWRTIVAADHLAQSNDVVVDNIPDPDRLNPKPGPRRAQMVYVGDVTLERGALDMVRSLPGLASEAELLVVGRVSDQTRQAMEIEASRLGVSGQMRLVGRMSHEEAWEMAASALVGLNLLGNTPAYREAVATKVFEYMAVGLPPVVSNLPGQAAVVRQIDESLVCDSPDDVTVLVKELSADPGRYEELVSRGRQLVEAAWSERRPDLRLQRLFAP